MPSGHPAEMCHVSSRVRVSAMVCIHSLPTVRGLPDEWVLEGLIIGRVSLRQTSGAERDETFCRVG
eukprot:3587735-Alexandrium_andersonii.AAC.1